MSGPKALTLNRTGNSDINGWKLSVLLEQTAGAIHNASYSLGSSRSSLDETRQED
jgi:hypothetical protein